MNQTGNGHAEVRVPPASAAEASGPGADDPRVIAALEEYQAALRAGQAPDRQAFQARHPEIAAVLAECLEGLAWMCGAAAGPRPVPALLRACPWAISRLSAKSAGAAWEWSTRPFSSPWAAAWP